jgi:hypothetical protein
MGVENEKGGAALLQGYQLTPVDAEEKSPAWGHGGRSPTPDSRTGSQCAGSRFYRVSTFNH